MHAVDHVLMHFSIHDSDWFAIAMATVAIAALQVHVEVVESGVQFQDSLAKPLFISL